MPNSIAWKVKWESPEQREEYSSWLKESASIIKTLFAPKELVIFYLHYGLGWGRRKIKKQTTFSEFTFQKVLKKFKDYAKYASESYASEITITLAYADEIISSRCID